MITRFKHRGLERFFVRGSRARIQPAHAERIRLILGWLHAAESARDMNLPGLYFDGKEAIDVDYEDYH